MKSLFRTIIQHYLCRKSAIFNKVCGYSCMVNTEVYFVVDTSCKMALIHQAAISHFEMIHHACISKVFFSSVLVNWTWFSFRFAVISFLKSSRGNFHDWKFLLQWQCQKLNFSMHRLIRQTYLEVTYASQMLKQFPRILSQIC